MHRVRLSPDNTPISRGISSSHPYLPHRPIRTQDEVAAILGITKAQVTHAEQMALKKLRIALEEQGYPHEADLS